MEMKETARSITLEELLLSRDNRRATQLSLLASHEGCSLIVATVVIPGSEKRTPESLAVGRAACEEIRRVFGERAEEVERRDLSTGFEAYFLTPLSPEQTKRLTSSIEEHHPLGRLMDLDVVYGSDGRQATLPLRLSHPRRCLLCEKPARVCMRNFTHPHAELMAEIKRLVSNYISTQSLT